MKKLLLRFGILVAIIFVLSQIVITTLPFTWGNTRLNTKYDEYSKAPESYNTILVGASTTYRHIDCKQFDSYINAQYPELGIKSYNFGIPANRTPQSVYTFDHLMDENKESIKYVILDLSELTKMGIENLHKKEMLFWYSWSNIDNILNASYESEKKTFDKIGVPALHLFSFVEKSLLLGMGTAVVEQHTGYNIEPLSIGPNKDGFYSLNQEMADDPEGDLARRYEVLRTQDTIDFRTNRCQQLFDKYKTAEKNPNKTIEKDLLEVIDYCNANNIKILIMVSQRLGDRYEYLIPLYNQLPDENRVSFANPSAYPELNQRENLFDLAHLNDQGAKIFTEIIADIFLQKIGKEPLKNIPQNQSLDSMSVTPAE